MSVKVAEPEVRTYGGWRVSRAAGLGKLTAGQTLFLVMMLALIALVNMLTSWLPALALAVALSFVLLLAVVRDRHGLNPFERWMERRMFRKARRAQRNLYRGGVLAVSERVGLPGMLDSMRLSEHTDGYRRPFALVHHSDGRMTVVMDLAPVGEHLVDQIDVDRSVALFGLWLADLAEEAGITDASVTVQTSPDTGERLRRQVRSRRSPQAPEMAMEAIEQVVAGAGASGTRTRTWATLSFARRKGGERATVTDIATRLPGLTQTLSGAGAGPVHLLGGRELCEMVRVSYDPSVEQVLDEAASRGDELELDWPSAAPVSLEAGWDHMRHDSGRSRSWVMTSPPRGIVQSSVLRRLLDVSPDVERKRVTVLYRPLDSAKAPDAVASDVNKAAAQITASRNPTERMRRELEQARQTSQEEASGAGILDFGVVVTATVSGPGAEEDLAVASAAVENLAGGSRLMVRPAYGSQDAAFALGLPLGLSPYGQKLTGGW